MSHLHNFPCPTKFFHYQSRGMCKIPTLSTFLSKPYEPRDMKGNFGKFPHWDTSESSTWWFELNWLCRRLVIPPGQNLLRVLWMYAHEIIFRRPGTSSTPFTLLLQEISTKLDWPFIWLKISYFIVRRHIGMRVISCELWGIWLFYSQNAREADLLVVSAQLHERSDPNLAIVLMSKAKSHKIYLIRIQLWRAMLFRRTCC